MEPGGPPPAHVPVPPRRVVTDECYPFTSQQSQPAAPPCMMHSRSTGRGKRQATARCPNPQTHSNEIYQSTPAYRLSSSVSAGPGGGAGALWIGERGAGSGKGFGSGCFTWEKRVWECGWENPTAEPAGERLLRPASPQQPPVGAGAALPPSLGVGRALPRVPAPVPPGATRLCACRRRRS